LKTIILTLFLSKKAEGNMLNTIPALVHKLSGLNIKPYDLHNHRSVVADILE
jgi:hypothetical protein